MQESHTATPTRKIGDIACSFAERAGLISDALGVFVVCVVGVPPIGRPLLPPVAGERSVGTTREVATTKDHVLDDASIGDSEIGELLL